MAKLPSQDSEAIKDVLAPLQTAIATLLAEIDDYSDKEESFGALDDIVDELAENVRNVFNEIEERLLNG
jgi:hypothetical protein